MDNTPALFPVSIYFENGLFLQAKGFGARSEFSIGEAVFNTSLSGYQEIITDPSYAGQFVVFCMPEIGIVGCNNKDMESSKAHAKGIFVRNISEFASNFRSTQNLNSFLKEQNVIGITHIDTRGLVKMLRDGGVLNMIVSSEIQNKEILKSRLEVAQKISQINYVEKVSTSHRYIHTQGRFNFEILDYEGVSDSKKKILVFDYGVKRNILNELVSAGFAVEVVPQSFSVDDVIKRFKSGEICGVFLSNGPGDPMILKDQIAKIKILIEYKVPMFGICLGHQLLSIAHGHYTYKLKFGQHGGNHPVKNLFTGSLEITSQNHNYNVPESISDIAEITHRNLFDNTIEGVRYKHSPIFSLQHHPEASPGPRESAGVFSFLRDIF